MDFSALSVWLMHMASAQRIRSDVWDRKSATTDARLWVKMEGTGKTCDGAELAQFVQIAGHCSLIVSKTMLYAWPKQCEFCDTRQYRRLRYS